VADSVEEGGSVECSSLHHDSHAVTERVTESGIRVENTSHREWARGRVHEADGQEVGGLMFGGIKFPLPRGAFRVWQRNLTIFKKYWKSIMFPNSSSRSVPRG
jgi:hypothetical protein